MRTLFQYKIECEESMCNNYLEGEPNQYFDSLKQEAEEDDWTVVSESLAYCPEHRPSFEVEEVEEV